MDLTEKRPNSMKLEFEKIDPTKVKNWNEKILEAPNCSIFQTSNWANVLVDSYGFHPIYLTIYKNNSFDFMLPFMEVKNFFVGKKGISLPFTDFCEPIYQNDFNPFLEELLNIIQSFGWKSIELRGGNGFYKFKMPSISYYSHILNLKNIETLCSQLKSNVKRNIKKAQKENMRIKIENSIDSLNNYYQLHCLTRKRHGLPPQSLRFFKNIYKHIITKGYGKIVSAYIGEKAIASAVYLDFGNQVIYKFGASNINYQHLRPNNLVMWEAIRYFADQGFHTLHLGKTEIQNHGLKRFKKSWGAEEAICNYYKFQFQKNSFVTEKSRENGWYNFVFNKTPVNVLRLIGAIIYKHAA